MPPKIYHLHPLVAGHWSNWSSQFARIQALGFDQVCCAPPFVPGEKGDIFVTADHERLHPALGWDGSADEGLSQLAAAAGAHGLRLLLDVTLDEVAGDAAIRQRQPDWFGNAFCGGPPDPRRGPLRLGVGYARFRDIRTAEPLIGWWTDRLKRLLDAGIGGFRCLEPHRVPAVVWRRIIEAVRAVSADSTMLAWTPGAPRDALAGLAGLGFDRVCASTAWWDGRDPWLLDEIEALHAIAPALAAPEASFAERLANRLPPETDLPTAYRHVMRRCAAVGAGWFVPMGFEYGARISFDAAHASPEDLDRARQEAPADFYQDIIAANALIDQIAALSPGDTLRPLTGSAAPATALLRTGEAAARDAARALLVLINPAFGHAAPVPLPLSPLPPQAGAPLCSPRLLDENDGDPANLLEPGEVRILLYGRAPDIAGASPAGPVERAHMEATRIAIEAIDPSVPDGDYAVKRVVGDTVLASADIVADGHEVLAASLLWRPADEADWRRVPMRLAVNDRWEAGFTPERVGPHFFTVEAWWDVWGTFRHDLHAKHAAGQSVTLEIEEGRQMIVTALDRASGAEREALRAVLDKVAASDEAQRVELLLSDNALAAMHAVDPHPFSAWHKELRLDVDRPQAMFASWYELFPRSATNDPHRHGTFNDVIAQLPRIRAMGFDVLYFPPIHPIGRVNRKGRNNALRAEPDDVGSPYAIGSDEGGHDAVHPQLGTLEDFRHLVAAAKDNGLEIAIDFAVQCAPDHPWLKQHPGWFRWRPDGSMRYAENPPKKYEDIVNPEFYADGAIPSLWFALRDIVQFWCDQGVRIFRVDNPHTKPMPFWRWMIADIRDRHPDALFLAEAFTRPKVMYRLAKEGFTQSYTYFTWRDTKQELTEYLTEMNAAPVRDFFRPNFFVNTPDINPIPLQTSGRPGFLIRAALATTLSGLWGMYSGFEICESAPLPGREEYLDAEKYEIRVRDFNAPGNIVGEITALNHIRRAHPALQTHLGVTFYNAFNDRILLYGKRRPADAEMLLIAVNLDPHAPQECTIEIPLWEFGQPDQGMLNVVDLMRGHRFAWHGKNQYIRLDPAELPFSIWQLTPPGAY